MGLRIVIVDDHEVIRAGLHALLNGEQDIEIVGEAESSETAMQLIEQVRPDIVLMDISMPGTNGIDATRLIKRNFSDIRVLILTVHEDRELLQEALMIGASGYILKPTAKSELIDAIHAINRGDLYVHSPLTRALLKNALEPASDISNDPSTLTKHEGEVLRLIVKGYTNNQIGEELFISSRTVEFHRRNIMEKLGLENRAGLVKYAEEHGLA